MNANTKLDAVELLGKEEHDRLVAEIERTAVEAYEEEALGHLMKKLNITFPVKLKASCVLNMYMDENKGVTAEPYIDFRLDFSEVPDDLFSNAQAAILQSAFLRGLEGTATENV